MEGFGSPNKNSRKRLRDDERLNIDLTRMPRDVWDLMSQFLSLKDLKNLAQVNQVLAHRMRVLMMSKFRFIVHGSLAEFRALGWTRSCLNIGLTQPESAFELLEDDTFVDIQFRGGCNKPVKDVHWPSHLTHLTFQWFLNQPVDCLPASLAHLTFGMFFNQPVDRLPASLTHLTFGYCFDQPVDCLPASLTHLTFGHDFDQPVDRLPASLTHLTFGHDFNQPVDRLPASLTYLKFGEHFDQPMDHLPASLTHLAFGWGFDQPVDRLPASLTHLTFGRHLNQPVDHLPASLTFIHVYTRAQIDLFAPKYRRLIVYE
jgi:hypothetical protein